MIQIESFTGEWGFLSNFYPVAVVYEGMAYASVEHAYQAAKTLDMDKRWLFSSEGNPRLTAAQSKRMGRNLKKIRTDWEDVKHQIMRELLVSKFANPELGVRLLSTENAVLVEGNYWHDTHWGVCMGKCDFPHEPVGDNWLGRLLMEVRSQLSTGASCPKHDDESKPLSLPTLLQPSADSSVPLAAPSTQPSEPHE
jgi:ribA/ribD-fused uncharacterized protein